jgi:prostaglandin-endoperoxide synthase 2
MEVAMPDWMEEFARLCGGIVNGIPVLSREASHTVINLAVGATRTRPHPWSTFSPYTSWRGLTDRTYLARHLPPVDPPADLPDPKRVQELFVRPAGAQALSKKSTCLFPAFAQYLTDGFIRTDPTNPAKTTSNHEIDLCPLYGRTPVQTAALRLKSRAAGQRGLLRYQMINGEEYAPYLYNNDGTAVDPAFAGLDPPLFGPGNPPPPPPARLKTLFAFGGDRVNSTPFSAMLNTLLLREHNRIAGVLEAQHPDWDDDRVFETARNILIPIFIRIVIEQYINHITPLPFKIVADPSVVWAANWNRPNWITAEFSLLYRWHSLMPDAIKWPGGDILLGDFGLNNEPLTRVGLYAAFAAAAAQPAAELGALNTCEALLPIEERAVQQARVNKLDTYNNYRRAFGKSPAASFSDITSNAAIAGILKGLYGTPDRVEFYPGLFAEDRVKNSPLPGLLMTMVAVDAFSQALTNPLLSEHVFNAATFTTWGLELINETPSLGAVVARNVPNRVTQPIVMTQPNWVPE